MKISKYELQIFNNILSTIAEEMGSILVRSSFSPNIKERRDLSCAIFNSAGEMIAQAAHIPVHLGSMSFSVSSILEEKDISDGDVFILNDPFKGGTHLPDITCVAPVFYNDELVFFVASRAHHADIGGKTPGSMPQSTSIHDEGILISPTKIISKGTLNEAFLNSIFSITADPIEREGDLRAQISSLNIGTERILDSIKKYGIDKIQISSDQLLEYSEQIMNSVISDIPDGSYEFVDYLDDDGQDTKDIPIKLDLKIEDTKAILDFKDSSKQVKGCLNAPLSVTTSAVVYCFQCLCPEEMPLNSGSLRPIEINVDENSILNAKYPSAVVGGNVETSQRIVDVVFGAMSKAIPEKIQAASSGTMNNITFGGLNPHTGSNYAYYETIAGGMGGRSGKDGVNAVHTHMTNTLNTPVEAIERELPIRVEKYKIRPNSGGDGKFRGGNGIIREYKFLSDAEVSIITERRYHNPYGVEDGGKGKTGNNNLITKSNREVLPPKISFHIQKGDILSIETPGGGAWGKNKSGE